MSHESEGETIIIPPFTIKVYKGLRNWLARAYHDEGWHLVAAGETKARAKLAILAAIEEWGEEANKP